MFETRAEKAFYLALALLCAIFMMWAFGGFFSMRQFLHLLLPISLAFAGITVIIFFSP